MNTIKIRNNQTLFNAINEGYTPKYVFFWGHQKKNVNEISKSCFSQWYEASFIINCQKYLSAEHFMMAEKAKVFNDDETHIKILKASNPGAAKRLGREVKNFDEDLWIKKRFEIVVNGNIAKFTQNVALKEYLINTGNKILVEASPVDRIWGVGLAADNPEIQDPNKWNGLNWICINGSQG